MAEGTNDFLRGSFLLMELLDVSLMAVSERLDSEDGQDHREFEWIYLDIPFQRHGCVGVSVLVRIGGAVHP